MSRARGNEFFKSSDERLCLSHRIGVLRSRAIFIRRLEFVIGPRNAASVSSTLPIRKANARSEMLELLRINGSSIFEHFNIILVSYR